MPIRYYSDYVEHALPPVFLAKVRSQIPDRLGAYDFVYVSHMSREGNPPYWRISLNSSGKSYLSDLPHTLVVPTAMDLTLYKGWVGKGHAGFGMVARYYENEDTAHRDAAPYPPTKSQKRISELEAKCVDLERRVRVLSLRGNRFMGRSSYEPKALQAAQKRIQELEERCKDLEERLRRMSLRLRNTESEPLPPDFGLHGGPGD